MTGAVIYNINSGWVPPVDYVLEVYDDTSPAVMYADTIWMQLKDCIIIAAGDIYTAGATSDLDHDTAAKSLPQWQLRKRRLALAYGNRLKGQKRVWGSLPAK